MKIFKFMLIFIFIKKKVTVMNFHSNKLYFRKIMHSRIVLVRATPEYPTTCWFTTCDTHGPLGELWLIKRDT